MDVIFANHTFQDLYVQRIARLANQLATPQLNLACQHLIPILGTPNKMQLHIMN